MLIFGTNVGILSFCTASCKRNILDSSTQNHHCLKQGQSIYQNVLASLLSGGSNISVIIMMTSQKKKKKKKSHCCKGRVELSGVPVWQVQEGLVRVRGFKHRKLAQMACRGILMFAALLWQDVGKAFSPPAVERTGMWWMSSTYVVTMKSKPGCQSASRLDLARPCVQMTEEAGRERERGKRVRARG